MTAREAYPPVCGRSGRLGMEMKNRTTRCNGIRNKLYPYSPMAVQLFDELLPKVLVRFYEDATDPSNFEGEIFPGQRTRSRADVELTLRSWFVEEDFAADAFERIYDAVQNCAERDWFYQVEKSYADAEPRSEGDEDE